MVKEKLNPHPKVARHLDNMLEGCPLDEILKNEEIYGKLSRLTTNNPVRNLQWEYLFFTDSSVFRPAALAFEASEEETEGSGIEARYTNSIPGTIQYREYWTEQRNRCLQGYEPLVDGQPCGVKITGEYYFYLNFCRIGKAVKNKDTGEDTEELAFPDFNTMDYYWFKELAKRENPENREDKKSLIVVKARRKGFSYKNAAGAVWKYTFFKKSKVIITAQYQNKAKATFDMALEMTDFLNQYTEFGSPTVTRVSSDKGTCTIKAGKEVERNGKKYVKGRKSIITTVTLNVKADSASGNGATRVLFEEAGMITNLKKAWAFTEPTLRSGKIYKGIAIIFGTGGDIKAGSTADFSDMFYNPREYRLAEFENIYEMEETKGTCGYFVDDMWFREGDEMIDGKNVSLLDTNGNAIRWAAEISLNKERMVTAGKSAQDKGVDITQYCKTPSEAFLIVGGNIFGSIMPELYARLSKLKANKHYTLLGTKGTLSESAGLVSFRPDLEGKLESIDSYPLKPNQKDREGCLVIYEHPREIKGTVMPGSYIISMDTIDIEESGAESLIAIMVLKTKKYMFDIGHDELVAVYVGRAKEDPVGTANFIAYRLGKYYNAKISHENDRNGSTVREFFIKQKALSMLATPPVVTTEKHIKNSATNARATGHSMASDKHKEIGEIYLKRWLMEKRGINPITGADERNLDLISDIGTLEELVSYSRKGNFDRVMALMGCVIQQEETHNQYVEEELGKVSIGRQFANKLNTMNGRSYTHSDYLRNTRRQ